MDAQIHDIAFGAGRVLLNPFMLTATVIGTLALVTGVAGRVAIMVEDFLQSRRGKTWNHQGT